MKVWLDDERNPPSDEWVWVRDANSAIRMFIMEGISEISLDHDLGDESVYGTGYDVLEHIERHVADWPCWPLPKINIHTANPVARRRMLAARESIKRLSYVYPSSE